MAKRRLTARQQARIQQIQQQRQQRAVARGAAQLAALGADGLGAEQSGLLVANYGASLDIEAGDGRLWRCLPRQNLEPLAVGDEVVWQPARDQQGVVTALVPRRSLLSRPASDGSSRPLAANLDQLLVVAAPQPHYSRELIDQYLAAAELSGITPRLLLNKVDLLSTSARSAIAADLADYQQIGYAPIYASSTTDTGMVALQQLLAGRCSVFAGQSGVGKSSLVNRLLPSAGERVGAISEQGLGCHTTSTARLHRLPSGGAVIDSPGVREFRLWPLPLAALLQGFIELRPYAGHCRFRDCRHQHDPGCALSAAADRGEISRQRLDSFRRLALNFAH